MRLKIELDAGYIATLAKIDKTGIRLDQEIGAAMDQTEHDMLTEIPYQQHWVNGSGTLEGSFDATPTYTFTKSTTKHIREVGSDLPYSRRRDKGFMDEYDMLGRGPFNDPGDPYMKRAVDYMGPIFRDNIASAVLKATKP